MDTKEKHYQYLAYRCTCGARGLRLDKSGDLIQKIRPRHKMCGRFQFKKTHNGPDALEFAQSVITERADD